MSVLRIEAVRREIGDLVILDGVQGAIANGERVGLVGANGAGKTTLLRIIAGLDEPDAGQVVIRRGASPGMLAQEANLDRAYAAAASVRQGVRSGAADLERIESRLHELEGQGAAAVQGSEYARLRETFEVRDGYHLDQRVEETLAGLGVPRSHWDRSPLDLSGGEQTRVALARLLLADPELMLLDEPTNHLDVAAIEWLESALSRRSGALLVASHDRAFLDAVVTRIWELRERRLEPFRGAYSAYLLQREQRDARQRKEAETGQREVAREQELIQRYRSHRKFSKMHEHERRLEQLRVADAPPRAARLKLPGQALSGAGPARSGDLVVSLEDVLAGFGRSNGADADIPILEIPRLVATRGDRIGIVGPNGAGKTTLLRTIAGELAPLSGFVRMGAAVTPGYLAQLRGAAFPGATVLDALLAAAPVDNVVARSYLARFLFRGEDAFKPVSELSGGERSRLELALLGITPANLLLLDEPTNHLDIPAREALESYLRETPRTLLIVSHDRRLLETVATRLWVVEARRHGPPSRAAAFDGGYRDWRAAVADGWTVEKELDLQTRRLDGRGTVRVPPEGRDGRPASRSDGVSPPGRAAERRPGAVPRAPSGTATRAASAPRLSKDAYRRQRSAVEEDLTRLGLRKTQLELAIGQPANQANYLELRRLTSELADVDQALSQAEDAWLALAERAPR